MSTLLSRLTSAFFVALIAIPTPATYACTAFATGEAAHRLVAQSFDWSDGRGLLVESPRQRMRAALFAPRLRWTATYGSLALTTLGPGLPVTGMNEQGLTVEALVDFSAKVAFSAPQELTMLEWAQRALDLYAHTEDAVRDARSRTLAQVGIALHLLVCDAKASCAVIETDVRRKTHVTAGANLPVVALANRAYHTDLGRTSGGFALHFERFLQPTGLSWPRFATVRANLDGNAPTSPDEALDLLASVRISGMTAWQVVWSVSDRTLVWRDRQHERDVEHVALADHAFACAARDTVLDIGLPERVVARPAHAFDDADEDAASFRLAQAVLRFGDGDARGLALAARPAFRGEGCAAATVAGEAPPARHGSNK